VGLLSRWSREILSVTSADPGDPAVGGAGGGAGGGRKREGGWEMSIRLIMSVVFSGSGVGSKGGALNNITSHPPIHTPAG